MKGHTLNLENNTTTRLINLAKNEIGRLSIESTIINENTNKQLKNTLPLQQ